MHKHNFGQTLKLQSAVATIDIRSRSSIHSFLTPNNVSMQIWWRKSHWFRSKSSEKADFTGGGGGGGFKDDNLEN